jgi:hypothetical protein
MYSASNLALVWYLYVVNFLVGAGIAIALYLASAYLARKRNRRNGS